MRETTRFGRGQGLIQELAAGCDTASGAVEPGAALGLAMLQAQMQSLDERHHRFSNGRRPFERHGLTLPPVSGARHRPPGPPGQSCPLLGGRKRNTVSLQKALHGGKPQLNALRVAEHKVTVLAERRLQHVFRLDAPRLQALKP
jgi:hypothetical protein